MNGKYWDRAWSLVDGCTPVSGGCDHCWSKAMNQRFGKWPDQVIFREDRLEIPLKVKKPTVWAIWNDLFHTDINFDDQLQTWLMVENNPRHTFLCLTKRPNRMKSFFDFLFRQPVWKSGLKPISNLWLGVTAENQQTADERIPILLQIPAAHRWVSIEPMLEEINLCKMSEIEKGKGTSWVGPQGINWVVLGGETGPKARPLRPDWVRSVKDQCQSAGVPFFLKYLNKKDGRTLDGREHNDKPFVITQKI